MLQRLARASVLTLAHAGLSGATVAGALVRPVSRTLVARTVSSPTGLIRLISAPALQTVTRLVTEANKPSALLDADLQANVLRELNRYSLPKEVIRRYESNMIAKSEDAKREYIKALASLNLLDSSKLLSVLGRSSNQPDFFTQPLSMAAPSVAPASPPLPIPLPVQVQVSMWQRVGSILGLGVLLYMFSQFYMNKGEEGGGSGKMSDLLAKPKAHHRAERVTTKFADVKGINEVKNDLMDIVEYLRHPGKFEKMGAKLPKGILLYGPPGTGKTLLARAVAGEAGVPFFYCSGSEFDEIFVGVGSKRVRNLFAEAKKQAPCIVFIDEIDSLAPARRVQVANYRDGTINQLLSELDGFAPSDGVILIGATNLPESLDPALMRPGRFDKHIPVMKPDVAGRKEILELYLSKVTYTASDVDIPKLARATPGLTGADLANLVNLAAIKAATRNLPGVTQRLLEEAFDDVLMGSERKSVVLTEDSRRLTAYHEGGHALVSIYTPGSEPIRKVTIVPRGQSLGMVASMPSSDETSYNRQQMMARLAVALGGRAAEHLIFGEDKVTSGASSDFKSATMLAQSMVGKWGMSGRAGFMYHDDQEKMSTEALRVMEEEVNSLLQQQYQLASKIISERRSELERLVIALLEYETLTGEEVALVLAGKPLPKAVVAATTTTSSSATTPAATPATTTPAAPAASPTRASSPVVIRK